MQILIEQCRLAEQFILHSDHLSRPLVCRRIGQQAFYDPQLMGVSLLFPVENAEMVQLVDPDLAGSVYDMTFGQNDADVADIAFPIVEKGQIAGLALFHKMDRPALRDLLAGVAE